ncbi:MAG: Bax inhibitor-1 family protein [Planctomycetes bacterium]|nr:Bax inhibitor-1 family protein [Planctomycetota bacterium]
MRAHVPQADWIQGAITVEQTGAEARREFIRKTYVHFILGLMAFCGVVWAAMSSDAVMGALFRVNIFVWLIAMIGLSIGYRWFFASANITTHYVGFGLTIALQGLFTAPLFWLAQNAFPGQNILRDAFMLTSLGFGGLTGFVLISKKDFSFMGGFLSAATMIVMGILILGMFMGNGDWGGLLMSGAILLLFAGWVLYDTSVIQKHLPLNGYVFGATMLFIDFVVILRQVVFLLMALANND